MRRKNCLFICLLILSLTFTLVGCSKGKESETTAEATDEIVETTSEESSAEETDAKESADAATEEVTTEVPGTEESAKAPTADETTEASVADETTEAPVADETTEAPAADETTEAPTADETTEAPAADATTEAPETEAPTEPATEAPHVHAWSEWKTETEATCTKDGVRSRSCSCGNTETEAISAAGHSYQNGVCSCGAREYAGIFTTVGKIQITQCYWSNGSVIAGRTAEGDCMFDLAGNVLAGPYDGMLCPNPSGYVVAYNETSEVIDSVNDEYMGTLNTTRYTTTSYLLDPAGNVVYQTESIAIEKDMDSTTYEGEQLIYCNEDRIITMTYNTYWFGMAYGDGTLHIYDMSGNKIADIEDVIEFGNVINGKMILFKYDQVLVVDKNGQLLAALDDLYDRYDMFIEFLSIASGHHTAFFANGYVGINCYNDRRLLVSEDAETTYLLNSSYIYDKKNYGTLVFSKVIRNGVVSDEYYLLDVSKCQVDSDGVVIPSENAIVCNTPVTYGSFANIFGNVEKYALISTADGKWGYVSYDGQTVKLYDDAAGFSGGYAAVKDGDEFYVIDENFNRVSNGLTGYESVSTCGNGVYLMQTGSGYVVAVYQK